MLRVRFDNLTIAEQEVLTMVLYSRADSWLGWGESRESDNVLQSLGRIFQISMHGLVSTFQSLFTGKERMAGKAGSLSVVRSAGIIALAAILAGAAQNAARAGPGLCRRAADRDLRPERSGSSRPVPRHLHPERRRLAADRAARHRHQARDLLHAAADPCGPDGQDSHLLCVFSQPVAAAQPSQADHEWNAVCHRPAHAGTVGRLRQPGCRGGFQYSPGTAGA